MNLINEAYWKLFKGDVLQDQRRIRKLPLRQIKKIQWGRLKHLLQQAYTHSEFYRSLFESVDLTPQDIKTPNDFSRLPITDKQQYRMSFDKIPSKNFNLEGRPLASTSGSTGEPFIFYKHPEREGANLFSSFLLNKEAMGLNPFDRINVLEIKVHPRNEIKDLKNCKYKAGRHRLGNIFNSKIIGLGVHKLKETNIPDILRIIKIYNIRAIYSYSSAMLTLAKVLDGLKMSLDIDYLITIGEGLTNRQKEYIENIFNCTIFRDYSATEGIHMGSECKIRNGYHLDYFNYYFEFLKDNKFAKANEEGEIIVTNLNNFVFPFIRYRIGDSALIADHPCHCGNNFPLVKAIYGRTSEMLITPTKKEISAGMFSTVFRLYYEYINQYQIVQTSSDRLLVKIVSINTIGQNILNEIKTRLHDLTDKSLTIDMQFVDEIDAGRSGKKKTLVMQKEYASLYAVK